MNPSQAVKILKPLVTHVPHYKRFVLLTVCDFKIIPQPVRLKTACDGDKLTSGLSYKPPVMVTRISHALFNFGPLVILKHHKQFEWPGTSQAVFQPSRL
jgi:hypothetical protein